jgi:hypothetical protein
MNMFKTLVPAGTLALVLAGCGTKSKDQAPPRPVDATLGGDAVILPRPIFIRNPETIQHPAEAESKKRLKKLYAHAVAAGLAK